MEGIRLELGVFNLCVEIIKEIAFIARSKGWQKSKRILSAVR